MGVGNVQDHGVELIQDDVHPSAATISHDSSVEEEHLLARRLVPEPPSLLGCSKDPLRAHLPKKRDGNSKQLPTHVVCSL